MTVLTIKPSAATSEDTYINQEAAAVTFNYGIATLLSGGVANTAAASVHRILLKFNLSAIPVGSSITSAYIRLWLLDDVISTARSYTAHRALTQWYEGNRNALAPGAGVNGSTWNLRNANGSVAWAGGAGGASASDWVATASGTTSVGAQNNWYAWDVTADVNSFINGAVTNHGWWIRGPETAGTNTEKRFTSSDDIDRPDFWPELVVDYIAPGASDSIAGSTAGVTSFTATLHPRGMLRGTSAGSTSFSATIRASFGAKTVVFAEDLLRLIFLAEPIPNFADLGPDPILAYYVSLHTFDIGDADTQETNESAYSGYTRMPVGRTSSDWTVDVSSVYNTNAIEFPVPLANDNPITHIGIGTEETGPGKLLYWSPVEATMTIVEDHAPRIEPGNFRVNEG